MKRDRIGKKFNGERAAGWLWMLGLIALATMVDGHRVTAATINLVPTQDTWMFGSGTTDTGVHDDAGLRLADSTTTPNTPGIIMLQFNLAQLPANAQIDSAHLELYLVSASSTTANNIAVNGFTNADATGAVSFNEVTLSRASYSGSALLTNETDTVLANFDAGVLGNSTAMPALNERYSSSSALGPEIEHLQDIYDFGGGTRNVIFQLWAPNITGHHERMFEDREGTLTGNVLNAPHLVVEYTIIPEPSSIVAMTLGMLGVAIGRRRARARLV